MFKFTRGQDANAQPAQQQSSDSDNCGRDFAAEWGDAASDPQLTRSQRQRLNSILKDAIKDGVVVICIAGLFLSQGAIASERWTPNPERGTAGSTLSTGNR